jgi:hypothetical protein
LILQTRKAKLHSAQSSEKKRVPFKDEVEIIVQNTSVEENKVGGRWEDHSSHNSLQAAYICVRAKEANIVELPHNDKKTNKDRREGQFF